jgi:hypothetical protein
VGPFEVPDQSSSVPPPVGQVGAHRPLGLGGQRHLSFVAARATTKEEIDAAVLEASNGALKGILGINTKPLVSVDFNHDPRSSIYDSTQTRVMGGTLVKVLSWYDNEWGFSNRMLDTTLALMAANQSRRMSIRQIVVLHGCHEPMVRQQLHHSRLQKNQLME